MAEQRIPRLVDGPEAAGTDLADDAIARVEQVGGDKRTASGFSQQRGGIGRISKRYAIARATLLTEHIQAGTLVQIRRKGTVA